MYLDNDTVTTEEVHGIYVIPPGRVELKILEFSRGPPHRRTALRTRGGLTAGLKKPPKGFFCPSSDAIHEETPPGDFALLWGGHAVSSLGPGSTIVLNLYVYSLFGSASLRGHSWWPAWSSLVLEPCTWPTVSAANR